MANARGGNVEHLERIDPAELRDAIKKNMVDGLSVAPAGAGDAPAPHQFADSAAVERAFGGAAAPTQDGAVPTPAAPKPPAEFVGEFTESERARLKDTYGDRLLSVRKINPFAEKNVVPLGIIKQGFDAVTKAILNEAVDVVMDKAIMTYYDHSVPDMPLIRYAADPIFLTIEGDEPTDAQCATMRERWRATPGQIKNAGAAVRKARSDGLRMPLAVWQNLPADTRAAHYYDTVAHVDVYAISYAVLAGSSLFVQSEMFTRAVQVLADSIYRTQPAAFRAAPQFRVAWDPRQGNTRMCVYASPTPYKDQEPIKRDDPADVAAQLRRAQDALAEKLAELGVLGAAM
jgi:hypothetical protein